MGREPSQGARNLDRQWDKLAKIRKHWERAITRDTELELENCSSMTNEVPEIAYAEKNLSRQLAGPSEQNMQDLKHCVRYTLGHSAERTFLTVQEQASEDRRGGNDRSVH